MNKPVPRIPFDSPFFFFFFLFKSIIMPRAHFFLYVQTQDTDMYDDRHANVCVIIYKRIVGPRRIVCQMQGWLKLEDRKFVLILITIITISFIEK